jgi:hypothetical protein
MTAFMRYLDELGTVLSTVRRTTTSQRKSPALPTNTPVRQGKTPVTPSKPPVKVTGPPPKTLARPPKKQAVPTPPKQPAAPQSAKTTAKDEVTKQATTEAVKATAAGKAFGLQQDASEVLVRLLALLDPSAGMLSRIATSFTPVAPGGQATVAGVTADAVVFLQIESTVHSVAGALREFSAPALVERGYPLTWQHKRMKFVQLPTVLTLVLKRFDEYGKITRPVLANDPLEIPDECLSTALKNLLNGSKPTYRLLHVLRHSGDYMSSGHYTSYGKLPGTETWYRHDDAAGPGSRRSILGSTARDWALNTGYIYVYERIP